MSTFDVIILGAGAAGLFCAAQAGQRGLRVLVIDHADKVAEKIRISGGGRANFTNRDLDPAAPQRHFLSGNPHFCRSALARFTPQDFIALLQRHGVGFHEKHKGQLFCDRSAEDLIALLLAECDAAPAHGGQVERWQSCRVRGVRFQAESGSGAQQASASSYFVDSDQGVMSAPALVIATGGLSIPKIGATDLGQRLARQFGLKVTELRPGLVPLTFDGAAWAPYAQLAGLALPVAISTGVKKLRTTFHEDLLFTHRGLSGPAVLQISSYWRPGTPIVIDLLPGVDLAAELADAKARGARKLIAGVLAAWLPQRLADAWAQRQGAGATGRAPVALAAHAHGHRGLQESRGHRGRRRYAWPVVANHGGQGAARSVLHRRGGRRDRLAGRLQLSMGLGQRACVRRGAGGAQGGGFMNKKRLICVHEDSPQRRRERCGSQRKTTRIFGESLRSLRLCGEGIR